MVDEEMEIFMREKLLGYDDRKMKGLPPKTVKKLEKYSRIEMMKIYLLREL